MDKKRIIILFNTFGVPPNYRGYPYLVHVIWLAATFHGNSFPYIKTLYEQTAEDFGVSAETVSGNIKTLIKAYENKKTMEIFSRITRYPVHDYLTIKEFVFIVAEYLLTH